MHYLHGLKQLHVVFIPSSSFHFMIQLQNDFIFKLIKKEKKIKTLSSYPEANMFQHGIKNVPLCNYVTYSQGLNAWAYSGLGF